MASYEIMRDKGFIDVDLLGIEKSHSYGMENRYIIHTEYTDVEDVMHKKGERPIVIDSVKTLGEDWEYKMFKILTKREVILEEGEIPEWIINFSRCEKKYLNEKTKRSRAAKGEKGGYLGGRVPYGYYNVNKKLYIDDYESFVVKFVFYRYSQGCSLNGIAKELTLRGFRNRSGREFAAASIDSIISNKRLYQGFVTFEGKEVKGQFRGILEDTEELLTEEWKNRVFDSAIEARISEHRKQRHSEMSVPHEIKPYILVGTEPKKKNRRLK